MKAESFYPFFSLNALLTMIVLASAEKKKLKMLKVIYILVCLCMSDACKIVSNVGYLNECSVIENELFCEFLNDFAVRMCENT